MIAELDSESVIADFQHLIGMVYSLRKLMSTTMESAFCQLSEVSKEVIKITASTRSPDDHCNLSVKAVMDTNIFFYQPSGVFYECLPSTVVPKKVSKSIKSLNISSISILTIS